MNKERRNGWKAMVMIVGGVVIQARVLLSFRPSGIEVRFRSYSGASLRSFSRSVRVRLCCEDT